MSVFKEKKNKKDKKLTLKTTLSFRHELKLKEIKKRQRELLKLDKRLVILQKQIKSFEGIKNSKLSEEELDMKLNTIDEIKSVEKNINILKSKTDENEYLLDTGHILYDYYDRKNSISNINSNTGKKTILNFFKKETTSTETIIKNTEETKKDIMDKYLTTIEEDYIPDSNKVSNEYLDICITCNERRIFEQKRGFYICAKCGCIEKILIDNSTPSYKEPPREITYFAYKKINHANEFLSQFQAKESTDIDNSVYEAIIKELKKERITSYDNITPNKIREILKKLELTKYYEHGHYITNRLSGKPAPILDTILEEKLRNMFKQVQGPWIKYCPSERANFFSYPYIFFKFFQLLDEDKYLPYCRLLKSREKLHEHDEVWKLICKDLNWQYIPTV